MSSTNPSTPKRRKGGTSDINAAAIRIRSPSHERAVSDLAPESPRALVARRLESLWLHNDKDGNEDMNVGLEGKQPSTNPSAAHEITAFTTSGMDLNQQTSKHTASQTIPPPQCPSQPHQNPQSLISPFHSPTQPKATPAATTTTTTTSSPPRGSLKRKKSPPPPPSVFTPPFLATPPRTPDTDGCPTVEGASDTSRATTLHAAPSVETLDPEDDGTGINGIGYQPTAQQAFARTQRRRQQVAEWKAREAREARQRRGERRKGPAEGVSVGGVRERAGSERDTDGRRVVRFA